MFRRKILPWAISKWRCNGSHAGWETRSSSAWINRWKCSGIAQATGKAIQFIDTADKLEVWAVQDGTIVKSDGNPLNAEAVIKVRGRYRDFALLETPTLGVLTRSSRVATNVYETLMAARGKPVLFFPARFDLHEVQASDGYAYNIAIQRFNMDFSQQIGSFVSTDAQGDWWGGAGGGTVAHAAIASFMGDTAEAMMQFSRILPANIPRIALVDFNNDSVQRYTACAGSHVQKIHGIMRCREIKPKPRNMFCMVFAWIPAEACVTSRWNRWAIPSWTWVSTRGWCSTSATGLDSAPESWDLPPAWKDAAREYCRNVKIVVSGGFNPEKIRKFEKLGVPVDIYAVGSWLFNNNSGTVTDFTGDVVRVKVHGEWIDMAKVGRKPLDNPNLERVW